MYIWVVFVELTSGIRTNDKVTSHDREHRWRVGGLGLTWSVSLGQHCFGFNETKSFWCFFLFSVLDQVLWKLILVQQTGLDWTDCQLNILLIIIHDRGQSLNLNIVFTKWQLFCVSQLTAHTHYTTADSQDPALGLKLNQHTAVAVIALTDCSLITSAPSQRNLSDQFLFRWRMTSRWSWSWRNSWHWPTSSSLPDPRLYNYYDSS